MADILNEFTDKLKQALGSNLKSVVLYGSRSTGEATRKHSDYNLLLILDKASADSLKPLKKIIPHWVSKGNHPPMIFTPDTLANSADVFPMEFYDIKESGRILFGEDYFNKVTIEDTNLRHECEFELRSKLIRLKQNYILAKNDKDLRILLVGSITTFLVIFRHLARLLGVKAGNDKTETLNIISKKIGFDPSIFSIIYGMKKGDKPAPGNDPGILIGRYVDELDKISAFVNNI